MIIYSGSNLFISHLKSQHFLKMDGMFYAFEPLAKSETNSWITVKLSNNLSEYKLIAITVVDNNTFSSYIWSVENFKGTTLGMQFGGSAPTGVIGLSYYTSDNEIALYIGPGHGSRVEAHGIR